MPFGIDDALMLALAGGSALGGLLGRKTGNPNQMFADPNNPFYTIATRNYYKNLSKVLGANTPGTNSLLAMQAAQGGGYGGSTYVAGKQADNLLKKNRDTAATASSDFQNNLFMKGMELVGQGNVENYRTSNSFSDQLMTLGGGLFSRYFNKGMGTGIPTNTEVAGGANFINRPNNYNNVDENSILNYLDFNPLSMWG